MELDHVLIVVEDLESGAREFESSYGLHSVEGGRHSGWGTANRIVPLGDTYLELIAVVDRAESERTTLRRGVPASTNSDPPPLPGAVRTERLDDIVRPLGLEIGEGSRVRPDGAVLSWRLAGLEQAAAEPCLPFFIEWGAGSPYPGRSPEAQPLVITAVEVRGDRARLESWLDVHAVPLDVVPGLPRMNAVVLVDHEGEKTTTISAR